MPIHYKLVVNVPIENADAVRKAIGDAGGGRIGRYSYCSFSTRGIGRFRPEEGSSPHIGTPGSLEAVEEERIEVVVEEALIADVITAMKAVHPYEEIAYDIYPLVNNQ